jgi:hypothetical protein
VTNRIALFLAGGHQGMANHPLFSTIEWFVFAVGPLPQAESFRSPRPRTWRVVSNSPSGSDRTNNGSDFTQTSASAIDTRAIPRRSSIPATERNLASGTSQQDWQNAPEGVSTDGQSCSKWSIRPGKSATQAAEHMVKLAVDRFRPGIALTKEGRPSAVWEPRNHLVNGEQVRVKRLY